MTYICISTHICMSWHMMCTFTSLPNPFEIRMYITKTKGFPCSSVSRESACNSGDLGSIPGLGRSSGEGNGNPLQYSCLENPMDRGAWQATVHGITKVKHNLGTKPPPPTKTNIINYFSFLLGLEVTCIVLFFA